MTTSGSDPSDKPGAPDERNASGSSAASGWQNPTTGPGMGEPSGSTAAESAGGQSQPTGWERPASAESDPNATPSYPSSPASPSPAFPPPESSPGFASGAPPSGPDWPSYPEATGDPTRPLPPEQPYSPPYQPYDPQAMPGYGSSAGYPPTEAPSPSYPGVDQTGGGYGPNPYEVNPYQQGQYGGYVGYGPPPNHPQAMTAFVLGLVGLVVCPPVGIGGLVIGGRVRREIDAAPGQYGGRGLATAGWVLGIIAVVIVVLIVVFVIIGIAGNALGT